MDFYIGWGNFFLKDKTNPLVYLSLTGHHSVFLLCGLKTYFFLFKEYFMEFTHILRHKDKSFLLPLLRLRLLLLILLFQFPFFWVVALKGAMSCRTRGLYLSIHPSIHPSISPSIHLLVCPPVHCLPKRLSEPQKGLRGLRGPQGTSEGLIGLQRV